MDAYKQITDQIVAAIERNPGDPDPRTVVARTIRVDQAGEFGAVRIYEGQLAVLGHTPAGAAIRRMMDQERAHLRSFDAMLPAERVRAESTFQDHSDLRAIDRRDLAGVVRVCARAQE